MSSDSNSSLPGDPDEHVLPHLRLLNNRENHRSNVPTGSHNPVQQVQQNLNSNDVLNDADHSHNESDTSDAGEGPMFIIPPRPDTPSDSSWPIGLALESSDSSIDELLTSNDAQSAQFDTDNDAAAATSASSISPWSIQRNQELDSTGIEAYIQEQVSSINLAQVFEPTAPNNTFSAQVPARPDDSLSTIESTDGNDDLPSSILPGVSGIDERHHRGHQYANNPTVTTNPMATGSPNFPFINAFNSTEPLGNEATISAINQQWALAAAVQAAELSNGLPQSTGVNRSPIFQNDQSTNPLEDNQNQTSGLFQLNPSLITAPPPSTVPTINNSMPAQLFSTSTSSAVPGTSNPQNLSIFGNNPFTNYGNILGANTDAGNSLQGLLDTYQANSIFSNDRDMSLLNTDTSSVGNAGNLPGLGNAGNLPGLGNAGNLPGLSNNSMPNNVTSPNWSTVPPPILPQLGQGFENTLTPEEEDEAYNYIRNIVMGLRVPPSVSAVGTTNSGASTNPFEQLVSSLMESNNQVASSNDQGRRTLAPPPGLTHPGIANSRNNDNQITQENLEQWLQLAEASPPFPSAQNNTSVAPQSSATTPSTASTLNNLPMFRLTDTNPARTRIIRVPRVRWSISQQQLTVDGTEPITIQEPVANNVGNDRWNGTSASFNPLQQFSGRNFGIQEQTFGNTSTSPIVPMTQHEENEHLRNRINREINDKNMLLDKMRIMDAKIKSQKGQVQNVTQNLNRSFEEKNLLQDSVNRLQRKVAKAEIMQDVLFKMFLENNHLKMKVKSLQRENSVMAKEVEQILDFFSRKGKKKRSHATPAPPDVNDADKASGSATSSNTAKNAATSSAYRDAQSSRKTLRQDSTLKAGILHGSNRDNRPACSSTSRKTAVPETRQRVNFNASSGVQATTNNQPVDVFAASGQAANASPPRASGASNARPRAVSFGHTSIHVIPAVSGNSNRGQAYENSEDRPI